MLFFRVGQYECADILLRLHRLAMQFSFGKNWGYGSQILGDITLPVRVLDLVRQDIEQEISQNSELASRRRVILIVTDGQSDSTDTALNHTMTQLVNVVPNDGLTLISAGLAAELSVNNKVEFRKDLTILANGVEANAVSADNERELSEKIVRRMRQNGAICESQGTIIMLIV